MSSSNEEDQPPLEMEAKWADLTDEPRVVYGSLLYGIGKICVGLLLLGLLMIALHFDPILSKQF
jgi:hypothetical protein